MRTAGLLLLLLAPGCAYWAYTPTWKGVQRESTVALAYRTQGGTCGDLTVGNHTDAAFTVLWNQVRTRMPTGEKRDTRVFSRGGGPAPGSVVLQPGGEGSSGVCLLSRTFVVRPRPITGWDIGLGWYFGTGVLAGNIVWKPSRAKQRRVIPAPRTYGFDLLVPVRDADGRRVLELPVRGDDVTAFKYSRRVHGRPQPLPMR
ncbi:MAG: hypothetical protein R3F61_26825 [Myxococcota bacterium]